MANPQPTPSQDFDSHRETYKGFIQGSVVLAMLCFFTLVALVNVGFGKSWPVFWAFAGLIVGTIVVLADLKAGAKWYLSAAVLVAYGLFTGYNVL